MDEQLEQLFLRTQKFANYIEETINKYDFRYLPESIIDQEIKSFPEPDVLNFAYSQSILHLLISLDYVPSFYKLIFLEPRQAVAPFTCLRSFSESCAKSSWLSNPKIDAMERVKRGFAIRYDDLNERKKFFNSQSDTDSGQAMEEKIG